ncbi:TauD/TfdA dioxygenase family protein [Bordetella genomosp. 9]|uniref:Taurine dioxygenase n=1 Tax=Bordetella genomosp. 9 TaxID=1416803 RepID=A0A1W6YUW6_9BORD|nr:TauD/TfdA family dioxygenase [Bordetella genomosp. 9]ARP84791.1 taurine dioxygenase [Bordetella genomosp. 9]
MNIVGSGATLGARVEGIDLSRPLAPENYRAIEQALGRHGVLCFPRQQLDAAALKRFAENFGSLEVNVANLYHEPGIPEVMILSNIVENGKPIGLSDAGQDWHTDMSYSRTIAFSNVLYGIRIPMRDGKPLGNTEFCNMHAAYDELPDSLKQELDGMTVTHDFNKFWEMMRREKGSTRPPLTEEQRRRKPPVSHPVFLTHPITGRKVLYANPGYSVRINELPEARSEEVLNFLFAHQLQEKFRYRHNWAEGDVLMWDNMGTIHNAVADYRPDEPRLIKRCQVMADKYFPELY